MFRGLKLGEITKPYHLAEHCKNSDPGVDVNVMQPFQIYVSVFLNNSADS
ncbi:hypothetical protein MCC01976_08110 [Bifidobacteriaceae bacterium MCC01976]|nr:hypothetical protein MCC01976_08110 [Bifidobacteriaceae bacterium MCC01976]GDZ22401.1 hypothetical protein MCC01977_08050 [Bifidobacteriaceae bacterium MCC01977]